MRLNIIGSSSKGNAYVIQNENEAIVLEMGCPFKDVAKALDFATAKVQGVLISHEHGDHAAHVSEALAAALPVYASQGTIEAITTKTSRKPQPAEAGHLLRLGGFDVLPFKTEHDAADPLGFLIRHSEMGTLLFATDTYYIRNRFAGLNHILIECNYSTDILRRNIENGVIPEPVAKRTLKSHMSLENCIRMLEQNELGKVRNIVLIHMSDNNSDPQAFVNAVHMATGRHTVSAQAGMTIDINQRPTI